MASLQGLKDEQDCAALDPLVSACRRQGDAEVRPLAASTQWIRTGSWSGNPSDPMLHAALHTPEIPWGSGSAGTTETPCAHCIRSSGIALGCQSGKNFL